MIGQTFQKSLPQKTKPSVAVESSAMATGHNTDSIGLSGPDVTLSEIREQAISEKGHSTSKQKRNKREKRLPQREVPMRDEFFAKIG